MVANPVDMAGALGDGLTQAVQQIGLMLPNLVLSIIMAVIVLVVGVFVSRLVSQIISKLMEYAKVEAAFKKYKIEDALGGSQITPILCTMVRWYVMLLFLQQAILLLGLGALTNFINSLLNYVPAIFGAALLVIVAAVVGEWVREELMALHKFYMQQTVARAAKWVIVLTFLLVSLDTIGFHMQFVYTALNTILQGIVYAVAIAVGLAFGLGGQKDAQALIAKGRKKFDI